MQPISNQVLYRHLRKLRGLTPEEIVRMLACRSFPTIASFARAAGVSHHTVQRILAGRLKGKPAREKVCTALGVTDDPWAD